MEALSRREEQEIEAAAKSEALRKCDSFVKGESELYEPHKTSGRKTGRWDERVADILVYGA